MDFDTRKLSHAAPSGAKAAEDQAAPKGAAYSLRMLKRLYEKLPPARQREFWWMLPLMLVGALAEVVSIGMLVPFVTILAEPMQAKKYWDNTIFASWMGDLSVANLTLVLAAAFTLIMLVSVILRIHLLNRSTRFAFGLGAHLSAQVFERHLHQPYRYHIQNHSADLLAVQDKINLVIRNLVLPIMLAITAAFVGALIAVGLVILDWRIALTSVVMFGSFYYVFNRLSRRIQDANGAVASRNHNLRLRVMQEGVGGIRDVILDDLQATYVARYKAFDEAMRTASGSNTIMTSIPRSIVETFTMLMIVVLTLFLASAPGGLTNALPLLGALALGAQRLLPQAQLMFAAWSQLNASRADAEDVLRALDLPLPTPTPREPALDFCDRIEARDVTFRYGPALPDVLHNVSLSIPKGARVGFVGTTGSGKSTLMDLLLGLLQPTSGGVFVDGRELNEEVMRRWKHTVAHVPQNIFLADATIAQNIAFGIDESEIDMERVRDAAKRAGLEEFIVKNADGYQQKVGERGVRLSGGQRQRIGIARALYKHASVLVFDEATSALDSKTEGFIMDAINELSADLTVLIIAHRLGTVRLCDSVFRLEAGRIVSVETGSSVASGA